MLSILTPNGSFYGEARRPVVDFLSASVLTRPDISANINPSAETHQL